MTIQGKIKPVEFLLIPKTSKTEAINVVEAPIITEKD